MQIKFLETGLILLHLLLSTNAQDLGRTEQSDCTTPTSLSGQCIDIDQCPDIVQLLYQDPLRPEDFEFLRLSQCGPEDGAKVCCVIRRSPGGEQNTRVTVQPKINSKEKQGEPRSPINLGGHPLLPNECGKDLSSKIFGGTTTALDEFPWMALLDYTTPTGRKTACGGSLISSRYVLTAAHCLKGKQLPSSWELVNVILGEYRISTDRDCIPDGPNTSICSPDPLTVRIEEWIAHEDYQRDTPDQRNDIALLRLSEDVSFSDYVSPICLPKDSTYGKNLFVAGWGATEKLSSSDVKLKVRLPVVDFEECARRYASASIKLEKSQICAGGEAGKDSCSGDSGGPLMSVQLAPNGEARWSAVGLVSIGHKFCGSAGWPAVYTNIVDFVPWILGKMRA